MGARSCRKPRTLAIRPPGNDPIHVCERGMRTEDSPSRLALRLRLSMPARSRLRGEAGAVGDRQLVGALDPPDTNLDRPSPDATHVSPPDCTLAPTTANLTRLPLAAPSEAIRRRQTLSTKRQQLPHSLLRGIHPPAWRLVSPQRHHTFRREPWLPGRRRDWRSYKGPLGYKS
jgi:hypothetical protein